MPKFLQYLRYSQSGTQGSLQEGFKSRENYVRQLVQSTGAKVEAFYWALGEDDVVLIIDAPDLATALGISLAVNASGVGQFRTVQLMTAEDMDAGRAKVPQYRPPGS